ncbi:MAG: hypothetical protein IJF27_04910 [Oscillospiraceae bacterium]|nr:hypothetical protein [Oscillospiraceae bacterium]
MKKLLIVVLVIAMAFSLAACGKSEAAKVMDNMIADIGEVTLESEEAIVAAEQMYNALTAEQKSELDNYALLLNARMTLDKLIEESIPNKEEMLSMAQEMDDYAAAMSENKLRSEEKYIGNVFLITGIISNIERESVDIGDFTVTLPVEDIIKLSSGQQVTVVGIIDSLEEITTKDTAFGTTFTQTNYHGTITHGYFVTDRFELSGALTFYYVSLRKLDGSVDMRTGQEDAWLLGLDSTPDDDYITVKYHMEDEIPVEHVFGKDIKSVNFGGQELTHKTKITVSAKVFLHNDSYTLEDAELVSVD